MSRPGLESALSISLAVVLGGAISSALLFAWPYFLVQPLVYRTLLFCIVSAATAALVHVVITRTRWRWIQRPLRSKLGWVLGCIFAGWLLTWMIPLQPAPGDAASLEVQSLGTRDAASNGTEVWVRILVDGRALQIDDVEAGPTWTSAHGYLISPINSPADNIRWRGHYSKNVYLEFFTHDWSGEAVARWPNNERRFNLYTPKGGEIVTLIAGQPAAPQFLELPSRTPLQYAIQFCQSLTLGLLLLGGIAAASRWPSPRPLNPSSRIPSPFGREVMIASMPLLLVGSVLLVLFLPAILTTDSLTQWNQAATSRFDDAHPVLYAFYLWIVQQIYPSTTLAAWLQIVGLALSGGWLATTSRHACNAPAWTSWAGGLALAAYPVTAVSAITLWKDVPYAASVAALSAFVIGNIVLNRNELRRWHNSLLLILLLVCCMALRHNGPPVALVAALLLMLRAGDRWRVAACLLLATVSVWTIKGPVADTLGTKRTSAAYMAFTHHLSAHLAAGQAPDSPADAAILEKIDTGADDWRYRCAVVNTTIFDNAYSTEAAVRHQDDLFRIWLEMASKRPDVELDHVLCASGMIWRYRVSSPLYLYVFGFEPLEAGSLRWVQSGLGGPPQSSPFPDAANAIGTELLARKYTHLWRPAPFLIGLCLLSVLGWQRTGDRRILLIPLLVLVHTSVLMIAIIAQDARYQLPLYIVFLVTAPAMIFAKRRNVQPEDFGDALPP